MSEESVNIIFIHRGANDYLKFSLAQAHKSNPRANIFLIGDNGNRNISDFVKHYNIDDYFASALKLENVYQHFSCNSVEFELFCIQRWFVLLDFIKANKIEKFFYADSDVLIFSDLAREWSKFSNFSFTLSSGACGHNSFWNSSLVLEDFCNFVMVVYDKKDEVGYREIVDCGQSYMLKNKAGGVCDMTFFRFYKKRFPKIIGETAGIIDDSTYDDNFSSKIQNDIEYRTIFGAKKIYWRSGLPYGKDSQGKLIRFNTLHLQGNKKRFISQISQGQNVYAWRTFGKDKIIALSQKLGLLDFFIKLKKYLIKK